MNATLLDAKKGIVQIAIDELAQRLPADGFFWLDIDGASAEELKTIASALRIDYDTKAWLPRFGKRARSRIDMEKQRVRISAWTVEDSGRLSEVHVVCAFFLAATAHIGAGLPMDRARGILKRFMEKGMI